MNTICYQWGILSHLKFKIEVIGFAPTGTIHLIPQSKDRSFFKILNIQWSSSILFYPTHWYGSVVLDQLFSFFCPSPWSERVAHTP